MIHILYLGDLESQVHTQTVLFSNWILKTPWFAFISRNVLVCLCSILFSDYICMYICIIFQYWLLISLFFRGCTFFLFSYDTNSLPYGEDVSPTNEKIPAIIINSDEYLMIFYSAEIEMFKLALIILLRPLIGVQYTYSNYKTKLDCYPSSLPLASVYFEGRCATLWKLWTGIKLSFVFLVVLPLPILPIMC